MFSFLKKSSQPTYTDKVWKTRGASLKGIAAEAMRALKRGETPVVFFFFNGDQERFVEFLDQSKIPHFVVVQGSAFEALEHKGAILVMDASAIASNHDFLTRSAKSSSMAILFFGHYPLIDPETLILEKLNEVLGPVPVVFCLSLEDGLLESFGSERIKPLMETLGMGDDECIQHTMVSKAIFHAREKLSGKVPHETKAKTEEEWFRKNLNP